MEMFWVIVGQFEHVICRRLYYRFTKDAGVSSSLMALKDKGEGEGRVICRDTCGANTVHEICKYVHDFGEPKTNQWGGMIQVALDTLRG